MRDFSNAKENVNISAFDEIDLQEYYDRRLYLNGCVSSSDLIVETSVWQDVITGIGANIIRYNREDKDLPVEARKPIILYINSPGGSVVDGFGLIDIILSSKTPVYTVNLAFAASMGFLIFLAGSKRFSMPHAQFLCHDGSTGASNSSAKMRDIIEFESNQLEPMNKEYVLGRTTIDSDLYDKKYRVEWYMLPKEAKEHGIVTHIIGEDCDIDSIV